MSSSDKEDDKPTSGHSSPTLNNAADDPRNSPLTSSGPPNGGTQAWLRVAGAFFIFFITWGTASSFGVYQDYYQVHLLSNYSVSTISWIGTVQVAFLGFTGLISGPLFDRGWIRWLLIVGGFLVVFAYFMLSLASEFYQILLSQGFCIGIGSGLLYVPSLSTISTTFTTKRPLAIGIASCGSAIGGIVLPIMFRHLQPTIGFGWVNRIFGFLMLTMSILAIILLRPDPTLTRNRGPIIDTTAFRDPPFIILFIALFFVFLGYWIPLFFLTPFASLSLKTSESYAFYLLAILNAGSFLGRILPALFAQKFGPAVTEMLGALSLGILIMSWIGIHSVAGITVWSVLIGFFSGLNVAIPSAVIPLLSPSPSVVGARTGMAWSGAAFAALIGSPIAGALVKTTTDDYRNGQLFGGASSILGGLLMAYPAVFIWRRERRKRIEKWGVGGDNRVGGEPDHNGAGLAITGVGTHEEIQKHL